MKEFTYLKPNTIEEAIELFKHHNGNAGYIAGGTDVIVKIKEGKIAPDYLISLKNIKELSEFGKDEKKNEKKGDLIIGAAVTHAVLENSSMIKKEYPIIYDAVSNIGSLQVRNVGTIGGNLMNAVPSADGAIPMIALDGKAVIQGASGERAVEVKDMFLAPSKTVLEPEEILKKIIIPAQAPRTGSAYIKFGRRAAMELPLIGIGVLLSFEDDLKTCSKVRICLGVAGPTPMRAYEAEKLLKGCQITEDILKQAGEKAAEESKVRDSIRGSAWHRKEMIRVHVRRMGLKCLEMVLE